MAVKHMGFFQGGSGSVKSGAGLGSVADMWGDGVVSVSAAVYDIELGLLLLLLLLSVVAVAVVVRVRGYFPHNRRQWKRLPRFLWWVGDRAKGAIYYINVSICVKRQAHAALVVRGTLACVSCETPVSVWV